MDTCMLRDPLEAIGPSCASIVLSFLGPHDLARSGAVSRSWRHFALLDEQLWWPHLAQLWEGKVYVPTNLREVAKTSARRAYLASLRESDRQVPTEQELCAFTWELRFKAREGTKGGRDREASVPWFGSELGLLILHRYFHPNHTVTGPPDDPLWGDVEPQRHYWYFRPGPDGSTVLQVNTYPFLECRRTPDWSWELHSAAVRLAIDAAAGPNPGIPPGHPAASESLPLEQIEAKFTGLLAFAYSGRELDDDDYDTEDPEEGGRNDDGDDNEEEEEEEGEKCFVEDRARDES
ncbi:hypothetical protein VOLCADRAFT_116803 [Volvox carteri f. nagariensis]|uniref:F-box domain-containing protein n=1 Tax=Volvox carteri f. nagariensis TaxID=3068 RepID=D8TPK2_VOLCA|nr:uncharacterized protein VOLCADRAFT_116803 [Volvox carteri f. nagariensis]EFJ50780.1 hypothetical protein VOLCADRAFT_116803 [Volvox carteri f. nagariensis]|eukprot:XP_002948373.1 hypothetical protein VOLCADRAFT_116803 [Volvox carteri f. nagariensis]